MENELTKALRALMRDDGVVTATKTLPVLVVDDNPFVCEGLHFLLGQRFDIRSRPSALQGLEALTPDVKVVILDIKMPRHDGFWAYEEMKKRRPSLPIIIHSAYQDVRSNAEMVKELQPFAVVEKGTDMDRQLASLVRLLEKLAA